MAKHAWQFVWIFVILRPKPKQLQPIMAKFIFMALTVMLVMQGYVSWHVWRVLPFSAPVKTVIILLMLLALGCMVLQFKSDSLPLMMH